MKSQSRYVQPYMILDTAHHQLAIFCKLCEDVLHPTCAPLLRRLHQTSPQEIITCYSNSFTWQNLVDLCHQIIQQRVLFQNVSIPKKV